MASTLDLPGGSLTDALRTSPLSVRTLLLLVFIFVSSGPFGVEEMVSGSGPGAALILILLTPLIWGVPLALICTELASAIPREGGAYAWVERGLGPFWAFQSGWWTALSVVIDTALYVVLAVTYLNGWLGQGPLAQWFIALGIIVVFAALNVRSFASMAHSSAAFALIILVPCAVMTVLGLARWRQNPFLPLTPPGESLIGGLGLGLTVAIWFYSGYESLSTMAGEIRDPQRVIPRALLLSLPVVIVVYFLPTLAALASVGSWQAWGEEGISLVQIAGSLGGSLLAVPMLIAALVSSLALYSAYLAAGARTTLVMAESGFLPKVFGKVHPRYGTPHASIVITAALHALLATRSFEALIVIDVFLFVLSYLLIFAAGVALRVRAPALERPFRIPVGTTSMLVLAGVPTFVGLLVLVANGPGYLLAGALVACTGPVAYALATRSRRAA
jgi:amino acid transporter